MSRLLRALVAIVAIAASVGGRPAARTASPRRPVGACSSWPTPWPSVRRPHIRAAFAGWDVAIEGHQGIFTDDAAELAWAHRDEVGALAVVATGYNYPVWNPALFDGWIDQMMGRLVDAGARHVFWLTLREPPLGDHGVVSVWEKSGIANHYPAGQRPAAGGHDPLAAARPRRLERRRRRPRAHLGRPARDAGGRGGDGRPPRRRGRRHRAAAGRRDAAVGRAARGRPPPPSTSTATWPRAAGYLTAWPCDEPRPTASNLNFTRAPDGRQPGHQPGRRRRLRVRLHLRERPTSWPTSKAPSRPAAGCRRSTRCACSTPAPRGAPGRRRRHRGGARWAPPGCRRRHRRGRHRDRHRCRRAGLRDGVAVRRAPADGSVLNHDRRRPTRRPGRRPARRRRHRLPVHLRRAPTSWWTWPAGSTPGRRCSR